MPKLTGLLPYEALRGALLSAVADPAAFAPFPYDWRLPVAHNAVRLAEFARKHLATWRAHQRASVSPVEPAPRPRKATIALVPAWSSSLIPWVACSLG